MINIIAIVLIYGILIEEMRINSYRDRLEQEKNARKRDNEWFELDKKISVESAVLKEKLRVSHEEFQKNNEEFIKRCEEINKLYEVKDNE